MKVFIFILLPFLFISCSSENIKLIKFEKEFNNITNSYKDSINCEIKKTTEYSEKYFLGIIPKGKIIISKTMSIIDSNKQPIKTYRYFNQSYYKKDHRDIYSKLSLQNSYDKSNRLAKQILYFYQTGDDVIPQDKVIDTFKYDNRNNVIEWIRYSYDNSIRFVERNEYDKKNYLTKKIMLDPDEDSLKIRFTECYKYKDSADIVIREDCDSCDNSLFNPMIVYFKNNNETSEIIYNRDGDTSYQRFFNYNKNTVTKSLYSITDILLFDIKLKIEKVDIITNIKKI